MRRCKSPGQAQKFLSRHGRINSTDAQTGGQVTISGQVPLANLSDYQTRLKSMTGGTGSYTMQFSHYDPVPPDVQKDLVGRYKRGPDED